MAIPEAQLNTWTHLGSVQQSSSTYQSIKSILEDKTAPYSGRSVDVFLQGSYGNDTNIFGDSDVDIVLRTRAFFHYDLNALPEPQKAEFKRVHPSDSQYQLRNFRTDVVAWLSDTYGADLDISGKKALKLKANGNRRQSDILLVAPHKKFTRYLSGGSADQTFAEGILFITTEGKSIINYPKQHSDNMTEKHQNSSNWLKPTVRIYKNMRNRMVEDGIIKLGAAPSYFIEGLLSNVPSDQFGKSWSATIENTFTWIDANNAADYTCANRIHPLIRDNEATSWPIQGYIDWLTGMKKLWNGW